MKIKIERAEKIALLQALRDGELDTSKVPALQKLLNEERPDIIYKDLTDNELNDKILELEKKFNLSKLNKGNGHS